MRGRRNPQLTMLAFIDLEERIPLDHPLRAIKRLADEALAELSRVFDEMYAEIGRPSNPLERLLKASLLIALYSVRSERAFCEALEYNLLFRWFLDMDPTEPSFDPTVFTKNRERLLKHEVGGLATYGPNYAKIYQRAAAYVDKILKEEKPADLPVEQPTTFDFVINLKTARELGLTIPQPVLEQATELLQ